MTTHPSPAFDSGEAERREEALEAALKSHYFGKWLAEAGMPEHVVAALLLEPPVVACVKEAAAATSISIAKWLEQAVIAHLQVTWRDPTKPR